MANIDEIRFRVAVMLSDEKKRKKRKMCKWELYMKDRMDGMTVLEIAKKYGVSHQAVYKGLCRCRKRMENDGK